MKRNLDKKKSFKFTPIPIAFYDPILSWGLGAIGLFTYRLNPSDKNTQASVGAVFGAYTGNKSYVYGAANELIFKNDFIRTSIYFAKGRFNYKFVIPENSLNLSYETLFTTAGGDILFQVWKKIKLFVGLDLEFFNVQTTFKDFPDYFQGLNEKRTFFAPGLKLKSDTTKNRFYPKEGHKSVFLSSFYLKNPGSTDGYNSTEFDFNKYISLAKFMVWANRAYLAHASGDVPFEGIYILGQGKSNFRGYSQGQWRGRTLLEFQTEFRFAWKYRLGAVGFAGVAMVGNRIKESMDDKIPNKWLPSAGLGIRFNAVKDEHINIGLDFAWGKNDTGLYARITESF